MAKQTQLFPHPASVPARVRIRVFHAGPRRTELQIWLNGDLLTVDGMLNVRNADFVYLMNKLQPEIIIVDRDNVTDDLWKRIKLMPQVELI